MRPTCLMQASLETTTSTSLATTAAGECRELMICSDENLSELTVAPDAAAVGADCPQFPLILSPCSPCPAPSLVRPRSVSVWALLRNRTDPCSSYGILSGDYAPASNGFNTDYKAMGVIKIPVCFSFLPRYIEAQPY